MRKSITIVACYFGPKMGVGVVIDNLLEYLIPVLMKNGYKVNVITNDNVMQNTPALNYDGLNIIKPESLKTPLKSKIFFLHNLSGSKYVKEVDKVLFLVDPVIGNNISNAVAVVHDINEFEIKNKYGLLRTWFRKRMVHNLVHRAQKIVAISHFVENQLKLYFPGLENDKRLQVIHNGIIINTEEYREENKRENYFLIVGRIDPKGKKLYEALKIYQAYKKRHPAYTLKIVGGMNSFCEKDGSAFLEYCKKIDGIEYLGYVPDKELDKLYKKATATIFYSQFEGFGFPVLESFLRGCPVISNAANKVNDELSGGYDIKIEEKDLENGDIICSEIEKVFSVDRKKLFSIACRFSWENSAKKYFDLIEG